MNTTIAKPESLQGHDLHRAVAGIAPGALHRDEGTQVVIGAAVPQDLRAFKLRASVCIRIGGRNRYPHSADWQARHDWIRREGDRHGFEVVHVYAHADRMQVKGFVIDATDFVGVLKVTDRDRFDRALTQGIGRVGRAWGMGMLIID